MRLLLLALLLLSCSPDFYCRRCNVQPDTVFSTKIVVGRETDVDTLFIAQPGDTVRLDRDRLHVTLVEKAGDTVYVEGRCDADTIKVLVPTLVENRVETGIALPRFWLAVVGAVIVGIVVGRLLKVF